MAHAQMGVDCDVCGKRRPHGRSFGDGWAYDPRFKMGISIKNYVLPRVYFDADYYYRLAYGPFTYDEAPWEIKGRKSSHRALAYVIYDLDDLSLEERLTYHPIREVAYEHDVSPFTNTFGIGREVLCVDCGLRFLRWFKEDGTPTAELRRHIKRHFWDDPVPEMWFTIDGEKVTRAKFLEAWYEAARAAEVVWDEE